MKAITDTTHYDNIAEAINYSKDGTQYEGELTRAKAQLAADNSKFDNIDQNLEEINNKLNGVSLDNVAVGVLDFINDDVLIMSGGLESLARRITT